MRHQLSLAIHDIYASASGAVSNDEVYQSLQEKGIDVSKYDMVGESKTKHNVFYRQCRWVQQSMKSAGMIENISRGLWTMTTEGKQKLARIHTDQYMIAASTELGVMIWGDSAHVFDKHIDTDVHLFIASPPYLNIQRSYGTFTSEEQFIDFLLKIIAPIRRRMVKGANLALNMSNDSILRKCFGERSLYLEKLTLRLKEELDLCLMDRVVWYGPDKSPKTYQVTRRRTHLTSRHEPILWFCAEPEFCLADNSRVLVPYSKYMEDLIASGGVNRKQYEKDYQLNSKNGGFSRDNGGSIPGNVLNFATNCGFNRQVQRHARSMGLPVHGALYPLALASFLIRWLCPEFGTVVDPFGGYSTSGLAAEINNRHWITSELHWEYIRPALLRFESRPGYLVNPKFCELDDQEFRYRMAH